MEYCRLAYGMIGRKEKKTEALHSTGADSPAAILRTNKQFPGDIEGAKILHSIRDLSHSEEAQSIENGVVTCSLDTEKSL